MLHLLFVPTRFFYLNCRVINSKFLFEESCELFQNSIGIFRIAVVCENYVCAKRLDAGSDSPHMKVMNRFNPVNL